MAAIDAINIAERDVYFTDYGETGSYRATPTSTVRTIGVIVDRNPNEMPAGGVAGYRPKLTVTFRNVVTNGVLRTELDVGGGEIAVAQILGGELKWFRNIKVINEDAGTITVELR